MRRMKMEAVRTIMEMIVEGKRGRERPKKKWLNVIKSDKRTVGVGVNE